jgi:hypothetical protein
MDVAHTNGDCEMSKKDKTDECRQRSRKTKAEPPPPPTKPSGCDCARCADVRSRAITLPYRASLKREDETFPVEIGGEVKFTIVHWAWRDPDNPYYEILTTCYNCGHDSFVSKGNITGKHWSKRCSECIEHFGIIGKRRTLTGKYKNPFNAVIDYDAPHGDNQALVYCPNYATCSGTSMKKVDASNQDKQPFYCGKCGPKYRSAGLKSAWASRNGQQNGNGSAEKKQHGGARKVKWTPQQEEEFLVCYEDVLPKIKKRDSTIPDEIRGRLSLHGNQPSDVAREYAAQLIGVEPNDYLRTVITRARARRKSKTR